MNYVDLTEPVNSYHWRYPNYVRTLQFQKRDSWINSPFLSLDRCFSHIVAPSSIIPGGKTLKDYDLFNTLIGRAAIVHLEDVAAGGEISRAQVEKAYAKCEPAKILILATGFGRTHDSYTHGYWDNAPHLSVEAAEYLAGLQPDVVGFDFAEDPGMCLDGEGRYAPENNPVHRILLGADILMIEYLNFLWKVDVNNADMYALPLNIAVSGSYDYGSIRTVLKF